MDSLLINWAIPNACQGYNASQRGGKHCPHEMAPPYQNCSQGIICCSCGVTGFVVHGPYVPMVETPRR